ncbi:MAG: Na+/H+ antiporter subunit E [Magnetococcales bacterium]|nr:Na+/H+ antiporter subunit E [Magnetococcales bacterium]
MKKLKYRIVPSITLWFFLYGFWLLLSGYYDNILLLTLGAVSCAVTVLIVHRMDVMDHEGHPLYLLRLTVFYMPWLVKEIIISSLDVAKIIINPKLPIDPTVAHIKVSQQTELGRVIYADSITRTPGTATIIAEDGGMMIHAITKQAAESLMEGEMDRRVAEIDKYIKPMPSKGILTLSNEQLYSTKE